MKGLLHPVRRLERQHVIVAAHLDDGLRLAPRVRTLDFVVDVRIVWAVLAREEHGPHGEREPSATIRHQAKTEKRRRLALVRLYGTEITFCRASPPSSVRYYSVISLSLCLYRLPYSCDVSGAETRKCRCSVGALLTHTTVCPQNLWTHTDTQHDDRVGLGVGVAARRQARPDATDSPPQSTHARPSTASVLAKSHTHPQPYRPSSQST